MSRHTSGKITVHGQRLFVWPRSMEFASTHAGGAISAAEADRNAERLAACWNACDGINPATVPDLLTALRKICSLADVDTMHTIWTLSRDALAKARQV